MQITPEVERLQFYIEQVALEEAEKSGFDIVNEPHGLFRAYMNVLSKIELMQEAIKRSREAR